MLKGKTVYKQKKINPVKPFLAEKIFKFTFCAKTNWFQDSIFYHHRFVCFSVFKRGRFPLFYISLRKFKCSTYVCLFPVDVFHKMKVFPLVWGVSLTDFLASSLTSEQTLISWFAVILNLCDITTDYLLAICLFLHINSLYDRCEYFHLKLVPRFMEDVNTQRRISVPSSRLAFPQKDL